MAQRKRVKVASKAPKKRKSNLTTKGFNLKKVNPKRLILGVVGAGVLSGLPLIVLGLMYLINTNYALPMFETVVGILLILVVVLLSIIAAVVGLVAVFKNEKITPKVLFTWGTGIAVPFFLSLWVVILGPSLAGLF